MEKNKVLIEVEVNGNKAKGGLDEIDKGLKKTKASAKEAKTSVKNLDDSLDALPGAAGNAAQGVKGLIGQFKALIANPIGLTIAAIAGGLALIFKGLQSLTPVSKN